MTHPTEAAEAAKARRTERVLGMDPRALLSQLEAQLAIARQALDDEAEGALRDAAVKLASDSWDLLELVGTW